MQIDLLRPAVVADTAKWHEAEQWIPLRRLMSAHRYTQYVDVRDVAAAMVHLLDRGLVEPPSVEAFNLCDPDVGTYDALLAKRGAKGAARNALAFGPAVLDLAKDMVKHRSFSIRYSLGLLQISSAKLLASGFRRADGRDSISDNAQIQ